MEGNALLNLGDLSVSENKFSEAEDFYSRALNIFKKADFNLISHNPNERIAYSYNKLAEVNKRMGQNRVALQNSLRAIDFAKQGANEYDRADYYINGGAVCNQLHTPDSAIVFLRRGLDIARQIAHQGYICDAYKELSVAFAQKKKFDSAYLYQSRFQLLTDTLNQENNQREILERETNLKIEKQKQLQEAALERQRTTRNIIIGVAISFITILLLLYNRSRLKQKNRFQAELNRQQQEILNTTIKVQDQERKRIAEDLHDGLGSILSATKLKLSAIEEDTKDEKKEKLQDTLLLIDEAVAEMKNIAYNMMPATLSKLGLTAALQNLFNRIRAQSGLKIHYSTHGFSQRLDESTEVSIYRIILESISNVVKHAHAKNVTVQLVKHPEYINITIEDDGIGFDLKTSEGLSGNGLNNISSRIKNLHGTIDIDTKPGSGTTILIDVPYHTNQ
jgi:signal transduction histidine kinase